MFNFIVSKSNINHSKSSVILILGNGTIGEKVIEKIRQDRNIFNVHHQSIFFRIFRTDDLDFIWLEKQKFMIFYSLAASR